MEQRFTYRPRVVNLIIAFILGITMTPLGIWAAATGAVLSRRGNALSPEFSLIVFIVIAATGIGMLIYGVRLLMAGKREIVVTPTHIVVPASPASKRIVEVPVAEITNVLTRNESVSGNVITIVYGNKKSVNIAKFALKDESAYYACNAAINDVWHAAHQQ